MTWFKDGDRNTNFFHVQVMGRRKRLQLKRIQNSHGQWLEEDEEIAAEAVKFFEDQFIEVTLPSTISIIEYVPTLVGREQNAELIKNPSKEEVKNAVFGLNRNSAGGPDGFTSRFFQTCWEMIGEDLLTW